MVSLLAALECLNSADQPKSRMIRRTRIFFTSRNKIVSIENFNALESDWNQGRD